MNVLCATFAFSFVCLQICGSPLNVQNSRQIRQSTPKKKTWSASNDKKMSLDELKELCGFKMSTSTNSSRKFSMSPLPGTRVMACENASCLPTTFSWLDKKQQCPSLGQIRKQKCRDSWAVSAASVLSDRHCLKTNERRIFSAREIASCAPGTGCAGGDPKEAMDYYVKEGVVSGGDPTCADQPKGCQPYPEEKKPQLKCEKHCISKDVIFNNDKIAGGSTYAIISKDINDIKLDLIRFGPLVATFTVFEDFVNYSKGIYQHVNGNPVGFHAVRLIGWGEEDGTPYWHLANSYGDDWGENGLFRMIMGQNECNIESYLIGAETKHSEGPPIKPQSTTVPQITDETQSMPEPQTTTVLQITDETQSTPEPQSTTVPQITDETQSTPEPQSTTVPQITDETQSMPEPQSTTVLQITDETQSTPEPQSTTVPQITDETQSTPEPQSTTVPQITDETQSMPEPQSTTVPQITGETQSTPEPQSTTVSQFTDEAQSTPVSQITPETSAATTMSSQPVTTLPAGKGTTTRKSGAGCYIGSDFVQIPKLCEVSQMSYISFSLIGRNSGIIKGNQNVVCMNNGMVEGINNIICQNSGRIIGNTNMLCGSNIAIPPLDHIDRCDANGSKQCESCKTDPSLNTCV